MLALSAAALVGCKTAETYTLLYTVIDGGYIDGFKTQQVQHGGDGTSVQAYPYTGYDFLQWSDGDYTLKVVNENGLNMLGNYVFELESDVLYAKWRKESEAEPLTHKILLVFIDKLNADLVSKNGDKIEFRHQMCGIDYRYADLVQRGMRLNLNEWFKDYKAAIRFEVDMYFTQNPVTEEQLRIFPAGIDVGIQEARICELFPLYQYYHNVLFGINLMDDCDNKIHSPNTAGFAVKKFGQINSDTYLMLSAQFNYKNLKEDEEQLLSLTSRKISLLSTYLHEFAHTCEINFENEINVGEMAELHDVESYYLIHLSSGILEPICLYLLGEAEYEGKTVGMPSEYWEHKNNISVVYRPRAVRTEEGYSLYVGEVVFDENAVIPYGGDFSAEAVVTEEGYRFVKWSDGVMTARRHDFNIISYFLVEAIFEKV